MSEKAKEPFRRVGLLLTRRCNFQCRHCYISAHPKGESLNLHQAKKIIDHFPPDITHTYLSGGEPFTEKQLLYDVLSYLSPKHFPSLKKTVWICTNGFWGRKKKSVQRIINELLDLRLKFTVGIDMRYDVFHEEQGLKLGDIVRIDRMVREVSPDKKGRLETDFSVTRSNLVYPIGRATSKVPREQWYRSRKCVGCVNIEPDDYDLVVDFRGEVHGCCWLLPLALGNAVDDPMVKILERARFNSLLRLLERKGIKEVASVLGWSKEDIEREVEGGGECWLCSKVFSKK